MTVSARVVSAGLKRGKATSEIHIEGASVKEVRDMFLQEEPDAFFPGASDYFRKSTPEGGQEFYENPLGGPPIMHTTICPTLLGVRAQFKGLMYGHADLNISSKNGKTVISESTQVRPNFRLNPLQKMAEAVPLFGLVPTMMRKTAEYTMGSGLATMHALLAEKDNAQAMARTLQRRKNL